MSDLQHYSYEQLNAMLKAQGLRRAERWQIVRELHTRNRAYMQQAIEAGCGGDT